MQWSPVAFDALHIHSWDGEPLGVVYNAISGDTHVLDPLGIELISLLKEHSLTTESILQVLNDVFSDTSNIEAEKIIVAALLKLADIGLIVVQPH